MTAFIDNKPWVRTYPEWFTPIFPEVGESILAKFRRVAVTCPEDPCIYYFDSAYSYAQVEGGEWPTTCGPFDFL